MFLVPIDMTPKHPRFKVMNNKIWFSVSKDDHLVFNDSEEHWLNLDLLSAEQEEDAYSIAMLWFIAKGGPLFSLCDWRIWFLRTRKARGIEV